LCQLTPEESELLYRMSEKIDILYVLFTNHLHHHFIYNITLLAGFLSTGTAIGVFLLRQKRNKNK
jgi:hypothetical protein